jgi:transposase
MAKKRKMQSVTIADIQVPKELYPRSFQPQEKDVQHLIGVEFPPIVVATVTNPDADDLSMAEATILVDGAHRMLAAELQGETTIEAEVLVLTAEDVLYEAIERNAKHGKQLSMKDKQKAAKKLASDGVQIGDLVRLFAVGERTVSRWVSEEKEAKKLRDFAKAQKLIDKGCSVSGAARELGVSRSTLQGWLNNPPEAKPKAPKQTAIDDAPAQVDTAPATEAAGADRVAAVSDMIVEFAKDTAKELSDDTKGGEYSPHWVELAEAAIESIRASYPKGWKVK